MLLIFHEPIELFVTEKFNWTTLNIKSGAEQRFCYPTPSHGILNTWKGHSINEAFAF